MIIKRIGAMVCMVLAFLLPESYAQLEHIAIQNITHKNGLSNNYINSIIQDSTGFIWIGTNDGLNRYDGYKMKTYYTQASDSNSISDNNITAMCVDAQGNLWVGTESNGLCKYNPVNDNFIRYPTEAYSDSVLSHHFITDIKLDILGRLWVTTQLGLNRYHPEGDYFEQINFHMEYLMNSGVINQLKKSGASDYLLQAAIKLQNKAFTSKDALLNALSLPMKKKLSNNDIQLVLNNVYKDIDPDLSKYNQFKTLESDAEGNLWLIYQDGGFAYYNTVDGSLKTYQIPGLVNDSKMNDPIRSIIVDKDKLWLGTFNNGVYVYHLNEKKFLKVFDKNMQGALAMARYQEHVLFCSERTLYLYPMDFKWGETLNLITKTIPEITFNVTAIIKDRANNYWIASEGEGVFLLHQKKKIYTWDNTMDSRVMLSKKAVSALHAIGNKLYVGYYRNNIDVINLDDKSLTTIRNDWDFPQGSAPGSVLAINGDANGLWVGTYYASLQQLSADSTSFRFHPYKDMTDIRGIAMDNEGNIWAIAHGKGLLKYDKNGCGLGHWVANYEDWQNSLPDNWLNDICIDKQGVLWIGSTQGICRADMSKEQFRSFKANSKDSFALSHNSILTVFCDSYNQVWIGTPNGLNLFDRGKQRFRHFSVNEGLANPNVNSIIEDHRGNLWLGTNVGISRLIINRNKFPLIARVENYDFNDGVPGEFYQHAVTKSDNGTLYFGGKNGITWFHPDSISPNLFLPRVVISDIQIFNQSIFNRDQALTLLRESFVKSNRIDLTFMQNVIGIDFTLLGFIQNPKNQYECLLEGFDRHWQNIGAEHKVTYTNLEPGSYVFKVKAVNRDGISSINTAQLIINVLPPFWRSNWGYVLKFLIIFLVLFLAFLFLVQWLNMRNRIRLRQIESENLKELDKSKSSFFTNVTHEFRTPITLILGPIRKIINDSQGKLSREEINTQLTLVNRNAELLMRLVNQIMDFKKADAGKLSFKPTFGNIIPFLQNITETFKSLAAERNIVFKTHFLIDEQHMVFATDKMEKIVYNLLSNAFKYTLEMGSVEFKVECVKHDDKYLGQDVLKISVEDSGIGIPLEQIEHIFSLYYQAENASKTGKPGTGVGLYMVKTYAELHGGNISCESELNVGSVFTLEIPIQMNSDKLAAFEIDEDINAETLTVMASGDQSKKVKILMVEDNADIMFFLKNELQEFFHIETAHNGIEALDVLSNYVPDIILSDVMMPNMDGYELCKRVKNNVSLSHIPFILLTAKISHESKLEGYEAGADDYLTKPFETEILIAKMQRIIESRKAIQAQIAESPGIVPIEISAKKGVERQFLEQLYETLEKQLDNSALDVEFLAKQLHISRTVLYEKVKVLTGQAVADFVKTYRLKRAAKIIESGGVNISEVVWQVGFKSHAHFTRAFKQQFECTPTDYLKRVSKNT